MIMGEVVGKEEMVTWHGRWWEDESVYMVDQGPRFQAWRSMSDILGRFGFELQGILSMLSSYADASRCRSISLPNCSTHFMANASSVKRLLEARALFRMANVASSDIESADWKADA